MFDTGGLWLGSAEQTWEWQHMPTSTSRPSATTCTSIICMIPNYKDTAATCVTLTKEVWQAHVLWWTHLVPGPGQTMRVVAHRKTIHWYLCLGTWPAWQWPSDGLGRKGGIHLVQSIQERITECMKITGHIFFLCQSAPKAPMTFWSVGFLNLELIWNKWNSSHTLIMANNEIKLCYNMNSRTCRVDFYKLFSVWLYKSRNSITDRLFLSRKWIFCFGSFSRFHTGLLGTCLATCFDAL